MQVFGDALAAGVCPLWAKCLQLQVWNLLLPKLLFSDVSEWLWAGHQVFHQKTGFVLMLLLGLKSFLTLCVEPAGTCVWCVCPRCHWSTRSGEVGLADSLVGLTTQAFSAAESRELLFLKFIFARGRISNKSLFNLFPALKRRKHHSDTNRLVFLTAVTSVKCLPFLHNAMFKSPVSVSLCHNRGLECSISSESEPRACVHSQVGFLF